MDLSNSTTKKRTYKHLSFKERVYIEIRLKDGIKPCKIAKELGRAKNTILNEIRRGTVTQKKQGRLIQLYLADSGQTIYQKNRKSSRPSLKIAKCHDFIKYVIKEFNSKGWSIDSLHGYAKKFMPQMNLVCTKTLYNYIDQGLLPIKNIDLPMKTRRNTKHSIVRKNLKNLGNSIDLRPDLSNRLEFGHWEIDTVIGRKKKTDSVLMTLVERKTRYQICLKIRGKNTSSVNEGIQRLKKEYGSKFSQVFKTITSDNGSEFSNLSSIQDTLETKIYYTHPYSSWERGTNERHNGMLRRFIPKSTPIPSYTQTQIHFISDRINALPRKILGYFTPEQLFEKELDIIYAR